MRRIVPICNLFANTLPQAAMRSLFDVAPERDRLGNLAPLRAIFPRHDAPVVRVGEGRARELVPAHWGFVLPQTSKRTGQPLQPKAVNNARDDKLLASSFWRESVERRRCLLPGTSFSEAQGRSPAVHHWFGVLDEDGRPAPFAFAAIWRRWRGLYKDEPREIDTVSMVTTTPNALVRPVHPDRMPAILAPGDWAAWLEAPPEAALGLVRPYPAERMAVLGQGVGMRSEPEGV
jgi:putative SOS response-associated peptidase YedK